MTKPAERCACGHPRSLHVHKPSPLHPNDVSRLGFCRSRQACPCANYRKVKS